MFAAWYTKAFQIVVPAVLVWIVIANVHHYHHTLRNRNGRR